ncbi:hypothetical protein L6452_43598 [Arctium lappa]|uniref:Uncharacterized protein n=1 Tax=Arctium lappa TaxID=4217 RepID=A0ACB8XDW9_ARCLA|nr:hypothetical protein L6452_43598 [Arctium lappa]
MKSGNVNQRFLKCLDVDKDINDFDRCQFVIDCVKNSKNQWDKRDANYYYCGPMTFLTKEDEDDDREKEKDNDDKEKKKENDRIGQEVDCKTAAERNNPYGMESMDATNFIVENVEESSVQPKEGIVMDISKETLQMEMMNEDVIEEKFVEDQEAITKKEEEERVLRE